MLECIGYSEKKGSFTDDVTNEKIEYDNVFIYYVTNDNSEINGYFGKEMKIKRKEVEMINFKSWDECYGKILEFRFNMFGSKPKLDGVKIVGEGKIVKFLHSIN